MNDNPDFYRTRAEEEQANADAATLDNVRDRCERAAKAWATMADRAERTQTMRLTREAATRESVAAARSAQSIGTAGSADLHPDLHKATAD